MNKTILFLIVLLILTGLIVPALGKDLPEVVVNEGDNHVFLAIVNSCQSDVCGATVVFEKEKLPSWLDIECVSQPIDITGGGTMCGEMILTVTITNAPANAEVLFPFTVTDASGHTWNYSLPVTVHKSLPLAYALNQNFPNPFNPTTTICYSVRERHETKLVIYNMLGQTVRTLVHRPQDAGIYTVQWDGRNDHGQQVSSGVYFYRLKSGTFVDTKRMLLLQ